MKPVKKIQRAITFEYEFYSELLIQKMQPPRVEKPIAVMSAILRSSEFLANSLLDLIVGKPFRLSKFINKDSGPLRAFLYSCYIQLDNVLTRIKNKGEIGGVVEANFDSVISDLSDIFGIERKYFDKLIEDNEDMLEKSVDPRDIWLEQDFRFFDIVTLKDFNIREYMAGDYSLMISYSLSSQRIRVAATDVFDETLMSLEALSAKYI